jgi:hypothetical protein
MASQIEDHLIVKRRTMNDLAQAESSGSSKFWLNMLLLLAPTLLKVFSVRFACKATRALNVTEWLGRGSFHGPFAGHCPARNPLLPGSEKAATSEQSSFGMPLFV